MNKLSLLFPAGRSEEFLEKLQLVGAVQLEELSESDRFSLQSTMPLTARFEQAQKLLAHAYRTRLHEGVIVSAEPVEPLTTDPLERLEQVERALEECDSSNTHLVAMEKDLEDWTPWGEFDPGVLRDLAQHGLSFRFVHVPIRFVEKTKQEWSDQGVTAELIGTQRRWRCYLLIDYIGELPQWVEEIDPPEFSLSELRIKRDAAQKRAELARRQTAALYADISLLEEGWRVAENEERLTNASTNLNAELEGRLSSASGWFPASRQQEVEQLLQTLPIWYEIRPPTDEEEPPVQLENHGFVKLFEPIAKLHSLPRYRELDPIPYFSVFFAFFVGCCLGDAAYGAIVLVLSLFARSIVKPSLKPLFSLLALLGGSTIFCGTMFNSFFGEALPLPAWLTPLSANLVTSEFPMMSMALVIGFIQILFAMGLRTAAAFKFKGWKEAMEPISFMLLTVGGLIWSANASAVQGDLLGLEIHNFNVNGLSFGSGLAALPQPLGIGLLVAGTLGILLFSNAGASPVLRYSFLGIWSIYNYLTKIVSDSLSYLRLFALGLAGGLLAASFNTIAMMLVTNGDGVRNYFSPLLLGTILILIVGHLLNLVLAFIGALVHPLRLTFVEFYSNMDYEGGGKPFLPLARVDVEN